MVAYDVQDVSTDRSRGRGAGHPITADSRIMRIESSSLRGKGQAKGPMGYGLMNPHSKRPFSANGQGKVGG